MRKAGLSQKLLSETSDGWFPRKSASTWPLALTPWNLGLENRNPRRELRTPNMTRPWSAPQVPGLLRAALLATSSKLWVLSAMMSSSAKP